MKIEKLTDNKIRVIVNSSDLDSENMDLHLLMTKAFDGQNFFSKMLEKAKEEVGFNTDGCKLLIEAFSSADGVLIFTITKYSSSETKNNLDTPRKKLKVRRKSIDILGKHAIYAFKSFDEFCDFCDCINRFSEFDIKKFAKNISLYMYNNTYYLLAKNINNSYESKKIFYSIASEFSNHLPFSNSFENKLLEHGTVIMKKNAVTTGIQYFVTNEKGYKK